MAVGGLVAQPQVVVALLGLLALLVGLNLDGKLRGDGTRASWAGVLSPALVWHALMAKHLRGGPELQVAKPPHLPQAVNALSFLAILLLALRLDDALSGLYSWVVLPVYPGLLAALTLLGRDMARRIPAQFD